MAVLLSYFVLALHNHILSSRFSPSSSHIFILYLLFLLLFAYCHLHYSTSSIVKCVRSKTCAQTFRESLIWALTSTYPLCVCLALRHKSGRMKAFQCAMLPYAKCLQECMRRMYGMFLTVRGFRHIDCATAVGSPRALAARRLSRVESR